MFKLISAVFAVALAAALSPAQASDAVRGQPVHNVVLVHGAFADGSGWRGVYDDLTARGVMFMTVNATDQKRFAVQGE